MRSTGIWTKKALFFKSFSLVLAISIVGSWGGFYWLTGDLSKINLSMEGVNTCFSRVSQNYSGKMIGSGQNYTSPSFYQVTEECFSDLEKMIRSSFFLKSDKSFENNFKEFVKKSYWFHRNDITENEFTSDEEGKTDGVTSSYKEIEILHDRITTHIHEVRSEIDQRKGLIFYIGLVSVIFIAGISTFAFGSTPGKYTEADETFSQTDLVREEINISQDQPEENIDINKSELLAPMPEKFDVFFNRFLKLIAPRLIRRCVNFDFSIDSGLPRVVSPEQLNRELELFFERSMNFSLSGGRVNRVDCNQINPKKAEIRFYDNGVCLLKSRKHFKNVRATNGIVLGVEYRHPLILSKKSRVKSIVRGKKRDLVKDLRV